MENKLHTAADSLRRERDAAQRKHWTAQERLRLTMEEVQAMEATVESLLKSRQSLEEQLSHSKELPELELHVQTLSKEVRREESCSRLSKWYRFSFSDRTDSQLPH